MIPFAFGIWRQRHGSIGLVWNVVGVFLAYAGPWGQALIDRRLYLPKDWAGDTARRAKAQVPEDVTFAPKTQIARDLIAAALDGGVICAWVLADALYGSDSGLRRMLEGRRQPYVLAVRSNQTLRFWTSGRPVADGPAGRPLGLQPVGIDAWMDLRTEKGYLHVGADTDGTTTPLDVGWGPAISRKAKDFAGKRSLTRRGPSLGNLLPTNKRLE